MSVEKALFDSTSNPYSPPKPDPPEESAPVDEKQSRYDKRIGQLTAQREDALRQVQAQVNETAELKARLTALEGGQPGAPKSGDNFKDWSQLGDTELAQILQDNQHDPSVGIRAMKVLADRQAETLLEKYKTDQATLQTQQSAMTDMGNLIAQTFGRDVVNDPTSPLRQRVEQVGAILSQQHGPDKFKQDPVALFGLFSEGDRQLKTERLETALTELETLKAQIKQNEALNEQANMAAERSEEAREALKTGGPKAATRQLKWARHLRSELPLTPIE